MIELDPNAMFNLVFGSLAPTSTVTTVTTTSITSKKVNIFKKRIKKNPTLFSVLKEDR